MVTIVLMPRAVTPLAFAVVLPSWGRHKPTPMHSGEEVILYPGRAVQRLRSSRTRQQTGLRYSFRLLPYWSFWLGE